VGTPLQWIGVFLIALTYCCGMLYIQMREKKADKKPIVSSAIFGTMKHADADKPLISVPEVVLEFLIGWVLAMGITFGLKALSWPLVAILVGPFAAFVGVGLLLRLQNRHAATSHSSPQ
jgi:hypothetical protein